jgi:hypothetical protein
VRVRVLLLPGKNRVPAPVFTVRGPPSDSPRSPVFRQLEVARVTVGDRHAAGDDKPVHALPSQRDEIRSKGAAADVPPKIRCPTSIEELPNRLFGLNQLLLKKQMA